MVIWLYKMNFDEANRKSKKGRNFGGNMLLAAGLALGACTGPTIETIVAQGNSVAIRVVRPISSYGDFYNAGGQQRSIPHNGWDFSGKYVVAARDGWVRRVECTPYVGCVVNLDHGFDRDTGRYGMTAYAHNERNIVKVCSDENGDVPAGMEKVNIYSDEIEKCPLITAGTIIAVVGATGSLVTSGIKHVHMGRYENPFRGDRGWRNTSETITWVGGKPGACYDPELHRSNPDKYFAPVQCSK